MGSFWDAIFGRTPPPGSPGGPPRQLTLPRLMNLMINPIAIRGGSAANFQKDVFIIFGGADGRGDPAILRDNYKNPFPVWIGVDLSLGALKTARGHFPIPRNFYFLSYFASSSSNVKGGFKVVSYDTGRRIPLTLRATNFNALAGTGSSPLISRVPYPIDGKEPKVKWTIKNLETVANNNIQFGIHGFQVTDSKDHRGY